MSQLDFWLEIPFPRALIVGACVAAFIFCPRYAIIDEARRVLAYCATSEHSYWIGERLRPGVPQYDRCVCLWPPRFLESGIWS